MKSVFAVTLIFFLFTGCASSRVAIVMTALETSGIEDLKSSARLLEQELSDRFGFVRDDSVGDAEHHVLIKSDESLGILGFGIEFDKGFEVWLSGPSGFEHSKQCEKIRDFILQRMKALGFEKVTINIRSSSFT